jgi:hypothetical protein
VVKRKLSSTCRSLGLALLSAAAAAACGNRPASESPPAREPAAPPPASASAAPSGRPVHIEMRNVRLHLEPDIILNVRRLGGEMVSVHPGQPPVFDRADSYVLRVAEGDVSMDMDSLTALMNRHVWNYKGSPLSNVRLSVDGNDIVQHATLHKGVKLPVVLEAAVSASSDGRLELHTEAVRALGVRSISMRDFSTETEVSEA